ncbi:MAG: LysM peptidoglycan-binding domain-containing protein [Betaproteobacteria bacterium]|nr:LysM peptidoglycan-binding domain-containing protein [Betaproteobacteria bacterium]
MTFKSSTRLLAMALSLAAGPAIAQSTAAVPTAPNAPANAPVAAPAAGAAPITPASAEPAPAGGPALAKDAPDKHVVVAGDTLWGIAGRFLESPWRWPEIWQMNREQVRNPHLIYPGDIIYLDSSGGRNRLRLARPVDGAALTARAAGVGIDPSRPDAPPPPPVEERLSPRVRVQPLPAQPIPMVNAAAIEPFLNRPLVVDEKGLKDHPRIVGAQEGRVYLSAGELAFARGLKPEQTVTEWHVYRPGAPLLHPDTRKPIAYEAVFIGTARLERRGDPAAFRILRATEEIGLGDRLVPAEGAADLNYAPRAPQAALAGRLISVYRGVAQAGRNSVISVSLGRKDGLEAGHVLSIRERAREVRDDETRKMISLPGETIGQVLVFRVFDSIAYGLIVRATKSVTVGDDILTP